MKLATGTVVEGKVVVEGLPLTEGSRVTVLGERRSSFSSSVIAEADRGETLSAEELLKGLRRRP